jgi:hypothetical protein
MYNATSIESFISTFGLNLQEYRDIDKQNQQILIITNILPGSCIHKINCFMK